MDLAVADRFFKGETMTVHQVEATTSELQLHHLLQLSGGCLYLVHCHGLPLSVEELVCHGQVLHQEEGGGRERRKRPRKVRLTTSAPPASQG